MMVSQVIFVDGEIKVSIAIYIYYIFYVLLISASKSVESVLEYILYCNFGNILFSNIYSQLIYHIENNTKACNHCIFEIDRCISVGPKKQPNNIVIRRA